MGKNKEIIYKRAVIDEIIKYLHTNDVIVLHGARQVGKTYIMKWLENYLKEKNVEIFYIDLEYSKYIRILDSGPAGLIKLLEEEGFNTKKKIYVFIDEIQYLENPSSLLKIIADHYKNIKLIVSGSSSFEIKTKFKDSLAGRTVNFEIFGLSFAELLLFKGYFFEESKVFTGKKKEELNAFYKEYVIYGGYPKIVLAADIGKKEKYLEQIIDTYIKKDIRDLAEIKDIEKFNKLLEVLASQSGQLVNITELSNTCNLAAQTVEKYLFLMENTYIIKLLRPFSLNSRSELFRQPKIFFYDSGLAQFLWLKQLQKEIIGNIFETSVFSELTKKYSRKNVYYWRTKDKKEIDFVLKNRKGLLPIEVKLNFESFKPAAVNYFLGKYNLKDFLVAGLYGAKKNKHYIFPWEI